MSMKLILASDHAGFELKEKVKKWCKKKGYSIVDVGAKKYIKTDDYPDYASKGAKLVSKDKDSKGLFFCGSAEGICIAANKFKNIRAVAVRNLELARMSRKHNDANVLVLAANFTDTRTSKKIVDTWLKTKFEGGRHARRVRQILKLEKELCTKTKKASKF